MRLKREVTIGLLTTKAMRDNYIYSNNRANLFRCKVPLSGAEQLFVVNGKVQDSDNSYSLVVEKGCTLPNIQQVIYVRNIDSNIAIREIDGVPVEDSRLKDLLKLDCESNILMKEGSNAKLLFCSHTLSMDEFETEELVNITLERDANLDLIIMQNEHNKARHRADYKISLDANSTLTMTFLSLHGGEITNNIEVNMIGEHANCQLKGLCLADKEQSMSTNVKLNHLVPNCYSNQLFKNILDDSSFTNFFGRIYVAKDAQKSEALQANHNLILCDKAKVKTKPQLEIYADDVICNHGATIGKINEDELFYMRSRGITLHEAKILQLLSFTSDITNSITTDALKERLNLLVEKRLRGEFSNNNNCSTNCC